MLFVQYALGAIFVIGLLVIWISIIRMMFMLSGRRSFWAMIFLGYEVFNAANFKPEAKTARLTIFWTILVLVFCVIVGIALTGTVPKSTP